MTGNGPESVDTVVVGAGVVGLAIARAVALCGRRPVVLESNPSVGMETSSRNSEVIHAGIYYPRDSLKALLCIRGRKLLYQYVTEREVPHQRPGKLIVASCFSEHTRLLELLENADQCGVGDLRLLNGADCRSLEPNVSAHSGLLSPSTGIVDCHALMARLMEDVLQAGGEVVCHSRVASGVVRDGYIELSIGGDEPYTLHTRQLVNAAGHNAVQLARNLKGFPDVWLPPTFYARGHYFLLQEKSPFSRLVYPVPDAFSLGVHATLDLNGATRFGPDLEWTSGLNYQFDASRRELFAASIRSYYPGLNVEKLLPGYVGVRPRLSGPGSGNADFRVDGPGEHGVDGLVNLFGIESPGLTASLALGEYVADILR